MQHALRQRWLLDKAVFDGSPQRLSRVSAVIEIGLCSMNAPATTTVVQSEPNKHTPARQSTAGGTRLHAASIGTGSSMPHVAVGHEIDTMKSTGLTTAQQTVAPLEAASSTTVRQYCGSTSNNRAASIQASPGLHAIKSTYGMACPLAGVYSSYVAASLAQPVSGLHTIPLARPWRSHGKAQKPRG